MTSTASVSQYRLRVLMTPMRKSGTWSVLRLSPSSPPVICELRRTSTDPACANASVTIANGMPETRIETAPVARAMTIPPSSAMKTPGQSGTPKCSSAMPSPYAPAPK